MKLGFGSWQLGGECTFGGRQTGWGKLDLAEAEKTVQAALESGIRFFDTAPGYGKGQSEKILGDVFSTYKPENLKVCTKFGSYENNAGEAFLDFSAESLKRSVHESLERLNVSSLYTILLHSPPDDFDYSVLDKTPFEKLKSQGLISHYGVSVKSLKGALNVLDSGFGDTLEAIFNVLDRRAEEQIFTHPNFHKYRFIARVPLASGLLSERFLENPSFDFSTTDIRSSIGESDRLWYAAAVKKMAFLNNEPGGISVTALRYVMYHPMVDFVIPGMRKIRHLEKNLEAWSLGALPPEICNKIREVLPETNPNWRIK